MSVGKVHRWDHACELGLAAPNTVVTYNGVMMFAAGNVMNQQRQTTMGYLRCDTCCTAQNNRVGGHLLMIKAGE